MLYARQAEGSVDEVASRLADAVAAQKLGVMGVHNLKQKMAEKGVAFGRECADVGCTNRMETQTLKEKK